MQKCDVVARSARSGFLVDRLDPQRASVLDGTRDVLGREGEVVDSGALAVDKSCDGALLVGGLQDLEDPVADVEEDDVEVAEGLLVHDLRLEEVREQRRCSRSVLGRDAGVVELHVVVLGGPAE